MITDEDPLRGLVFYWYLGFSHTLHSLSLQVGTPDPEQPTVWGRMALQGYLAHKKVHCGKPLHVFGLTSPASVVGAHMSLSMGYHYGPSADLLVLVCVRHEPPGPNSHPFEDTFVAGPAAILCTGGLDMIRKEAWSFYRKNPVSACAGSSKNLKDLKDAHTPRTPVRPWA